MKVTGLIWAGTRSDNFEETVAYFRDVMGLPVDEQQADFTSFEVGSDKLEVFGPREQEHSFFTTGPVVGFGVDDVEGARADMERAGTRFIGPIHGSGSYRWSHFHGPDGNVYEIAGP